MHEDLSRCVNDMLDTIEHATVATVSAGAQEIGADVFATAQQIARGFFLLGRNVDRGQGARPIEQGELASIAPVGFDAIAGTTRNQCRSDDVARNAAGRQRALQLEAAWAGFVTTLDRSLALQAIDEAENREAIGRERVQRGRPLPPREDCGDCCRCVLIEGNDDSRLRHGRPPLYAALLRAVAG
jgi:hypothetical protein